MSEQENGSVEQNVIQGPWPKTKRRVKVPDETAIELQEKLAWAEDLTQTVIVQMMHTLGENSIDISDNAFVRDMALIIEMTKGSIYRSMGIPHPTHEFFETLVDLNVDDDRSIHSQINLDMLEKFVEMSKSYEDDDDPEVS